MAAKTNYFRLGLFVLVALAILFALLFILGGRSLFKPKVIVETYFDESVSGLKVGSPVEFRGVPLGQVTEITISARVYQQHVALDDRRAYIVVRAQLQGLAAEEAVAALSDYIKRGLRFQTQLAGITGQLYLSLDFLDPAKYPGLPFDWKPDYPYIPSAPSLVNEIIANAQGFITSLDEVNLRQLVHDLNRLVVSLDDRVSKVPVEQLANEAIEVLKAAHGAVDQVNKLLTTVPIDQTVKNLQKASAQLDRLLGNPALETAPKDISVMTGRLKRIAESGELESIARNLNQTLARAEAILGNNQYDIRAAIEDLRVTADNLRTLTEQAKRYPAGLIFGAPPPRLQLPQENK